MKLPEGKRNRLYSLAGGDIKMISTIIAIVVIGGVATGLFLWIFKQEN